MKRLLSIFILAALFVAVCGVQAYVPASTQYDSQLDSAAILCEDSATQISFSAGNFTAPTICQWSSGNLFTGSFQRGFCFPKSHVPPVLSVRIICLNNPVKYVDPNGRDVVPAGIITLSDFIGRIEVLERMFPDASNGEIADYYFRANDFRNKDLYLFSEGFTEVQSIDIKHMMATLAASLKAYEVASWFGGASYNFKETIAKLVYMGSYGNEVILQGPDHGSYFDYEDMPSFQLGSAIAMGINDDGPLSTQLRKYLNCMASDNQQTVLEHREWVEKFYATNGRENKDYKD